jgi:hypothetical protein
VRFSFCAFRFSVFKVLRLSQSLYERLFFGG